MTEALENHPILLGLERPRELLAQFPQKLQQRQAKRSLQALVVEDQLFSRKMLHDALRDFCPADQAKDAKEAAQIYLKNPPHIAFLDIELPDGSGHELAALFRQLDPAAFCVMVTGNSSSDDVSTAMANGVGAYIVKPFNRMKIQACIEKYHALHPALAMKGMVG